MFKKGISFPVLDNAAVKQWSGLDDSIFEFQIWNVIRLRANARVDIMGSHLIFNFRTSKSKGIIECRLSFYDMDYKTVIFS